MEKHTNGDEILEVSLDGGKSWKSLEINPDFTSEILSMKFSETTIDQVI